MVVLPHPTFRFVIYLYICVQYIHLDQISALRLHTLPDTTNSSPSSWKGKEMVKKLEEDHVNPPSKIFSIGCYQQLKKTACDRHEWLQ